MPTCESAVRCRRCSHPLGTCDGRGILLAGAAARVIGSVRLQCPHCGYPQRWVALAESKQTGKTPPA